MRGWSSPGLAFVVFVTQTHSAIAQDLPSAATRSFPPANERSYQEGNLPYTPPVNFVLNKDPPSLLHEPERHELLEILGTYCKIPEFPRSYGTHELADIAFHTFADEVVKAGVIPRGMASIAAWGMTNITAWGVERTCEQPQQPELGSPTATDIAGGLARLNSPIKPNIFGDGELWSSTPKPSLAEALSRATHFKQPCDRDFEHWDCGFETEADRLFPRPSR